MLTEKENYLMALSGMQPEWVPRQTFGPMPGAKLPIPMHILEPPMLHPHRQSFGQPGFDMWGVYYVPAAEAGNGLLPEPNNFILRDIRKWRDVIKAPSLEGIDWEDMVKKHIEASGIDRTQTAMSLNLHFGYFQLLMSFMGFTEGLTMMFEEPDEVMDLFTYLCDFYTEVAENVLDLYKPDLITIMDDTAAWGNSFVSPQMYKEMLLPFHDVWAKMARERGLKMTMHNCGRCEPILDMAVEMGVNIWDPAQTCNDLEGIKAKYGNKLVLAGCWDARGRLLEPDVTDEEIVAAVEETFNKYAPGGGFAWMGGFLGALGDEEARRKSGVARDAADRLCATFYKTH